MIIYGLIDIDDFTAYNIKYGFENGNEILKKMEPISIQILSPLFWRKLDSDEFIFGIDGSFEQNKHLFSQLLLYFKEYLNITVSIGLTELKSKCKLEQIINRLRYNLLFAKEHGKNNFYVR